MKTVSYDGKWKGEVIFYEPLTIAQEAEWEFAVAGFQKALDKGGGVSAFSQAFLPGIISCVKEWHLTGIPERVTPDNFPARPRGERVKLINWLIEQISQIYGKEDDPNE